MPKRRASEHHFFISPRLPWLIAALMAIAGFIAPVLGPKFFGLSAQDNASLSGALGGALVGAAGALLAMLIVDWRQQVAAELALSRRIENTKKLIASELVNVAVGMIDSKRTVDIAVETVRSGGVLTSTENFAREMPRSMPFTDSLGPELLVLDGNAIDALVTLKANMERTAEGMIEVTSGRRQFGMLTAQQISSGIAHDMGILAQCFEHFAPNRKLKLARDVEPELATELLKRYAGTNIAREKIGF